MNDWALVIRHAENGYVIEEPETLDDGTVLVHVFEILGDNEEQALVECLWHKDGGSRVDRKKYTGYGFERQWQENPERMQEAVLKGVRKRQCRMTQAFS